MPLPGKSQLGLLVHGFKMFSGDATDLYFRSNLYSTMGRLLFPLATNKD